MQINGEGRKVRTVCPRCDEEHTVRVETSELSWLIKMEILCGGVLCPWCLDEEARAYHLAQVSQ